MGDPRGFPLARARAIEPGAVSVVVPSCMARRSAAPGSRRRHGDVRRKRRLTVWYSETEQQLHWRADRFSFGLLARVTVGVTKRPVMDIY
jgi:hypothetical protein